MSPALIKSRIEHHARDLWRTPEYVLEAVRVAFTAVLSEDYGRKTGPDLNVIGLDPCSGEGSIVGAIEEILPPADGLAADWFPCGTVFMNPPYSRGNLGPWTLKAAAEAALGAEVIGLVPHDPSLRWWNEGVRGKAACVLVWPKRVKFVGGNSGANFPSALPYWGRHEDAVAKAWAAYGSVWRRP